MGFIPREVIPGLPEESQRELFQIQLELQRALQQLGVGTKLSELRAVDYFAAPYERVRVTVPSAGLTVILPDASVVPKDAWIEVLTEVTAGTLTVESVDGQVNGGANVTSTSLGALLFLSNGVDGWYSAGSGGGGGAPVGAGYIVDALDGTLTNERVLSGASGTTVDLSAPGAAVVRLATIAAFRILANMTAGVAVPTAQTLDTILNTLVSNTVGALAYRDLGGGWLGLNPGGTAGHVLTSNGVGANPSYQAAGALSLNAQSYAGNPTGAIAAATSIGVPTESVAGRTSGNLASIASSVQSALIRAAGSLFFATAAASQVLRRLSAGDLGFGLLENSNFGTMPAFTLKGNNTTAAGNQADLTQQQIAEAFEGGVASITANTTVSALATVIAGGTYTIPANFAAVGSVYRYTGYLMCVRGATATALNIVVVLRIAGAIVATATIPMITTALTKRMRIEALITVRTTGAGGTCEAELFTASSIGAALANVTHDEGTTTTDAINTTATQALLIEANMSAAVAATSLTFTQGLWERVR